MLSLEEFLKLPAEEKTKRYLELSEKDRFLARTSDWQPKDTVVVKYSNLKSDQEKQEEFIKQLLEKADYMASARPTAVNLMWAVEKQKEIAKLYHNPESHYQTNIFTLDNFLEQDNLFNQTAGIYELDKTAKQLKQILNQAIENIINDKPVTINFNPEYTSI